MLIKLTGNSRRYYVYALMCEDDSGAGYMKIGRSSRIEARLSTLRTSCPLPLKRIALLEVESADKSKQVEEALHFRFRHRRQRGEWFGFNFSSEEDKQDFKLGSRTVFCLHLLKWEQQWWTSLDLKAYDAYAAERRQELMSSGYIPMLMRNQNRMKQMHKEFRRVGLSTKE